MNKKTLTKTITLSLIISFTIAACVSKENKRKSEAEAKVEATSEQIEESEVEQIKKIFFSLPSPIELTYLFKKEGINYQADKLHSIAARNNYNLTTKKALNL